MANVPQNKRSKCLNRGKLRREWLPVRVVEARSRSMQRGCNDKLAQIFRLLPSIPLKARYKEPPLEYRSTAKARAKVQTNRLLQF
jgi:hypothetical protein